MAVAIADAVPVLVFMKAPAVSLNDGFSLADACSYTGEGRGKEWVENGCSAECIQGKFLEYLVSKTKASNNRSYFLMHFLIP